jgi:hypothetical protein
LSRRTLDHAAQFLQRVPSRCPQQLSGGAHLVGGHLGPYLQRPGVQGDQRDLVCQDVVHLAGNPGALGRACLISQHPLLGLGALGPLTQ